MMALDCTMAIETRYDDMLMNSDNYSLRNQDLSALARTSMLKSVCRAT